MTTKEYAAKTGIPIVKVREMVARLPGAVKSKDANGRLAWDIPDVFTPPAGAVSAPDTPPDFQQPPPAEAKPEGESLKKNLPLILTLICVLIFLLMMSRKNNRQPLPTRNNFPPLY